MKKALLFISLITISFTSLCQDYYDGRLGFALSWEGHPYDATDNFEPFFEEISGYSTMNCNKLMNIFGNSAWRDELDSSGIIPTNQLVVGTLSQDYDFAPVLGFGWKEGNSLLLDAPGNPTNNWSNQDAKDLYLEMLLGAVGEFPNATIFIGNEVNFYYEDDPADYMNWVAFYHTAYDSIKSVYPSATIGTIFNFEHLTGQGALNGWETEYWEALTSFNYSKIDVLGLTIYPFFNYPNVNSIPQGYLQQIIDTVGTNQQISITETGWPADNLLPFTPLWETSPQVQDEYVSALFDNIVEEREQIESINWLFLNYLMDYNSSIENRIFASVSMRDSVGNDYPSLAKWLNYCEGALSNSNQISDIEPHTWSLFPNPTSNSLSLLYSSDIENSTSGEIINIFGQVISEIVIKDQKTVLDVSTLNKGIYFIRVGTDLVKFIKK